MATSVYGGIGKDGFDMKLYDRQVGVFGIEACVQTVRLAFSADCAAEPPPPPPTRPHTSFAE